MNRLNEDTYVKIQNLKTISTMKNNTQKNVYLVSPVVFRVQSVSFFTVRGSYVVQSYT